MKNLFQSLLVILLMCNGVAAVLCGIFLLYHLHFAVWIDHFLIPGVLLFILLGLTSVILVFFMRKKTVLLASCALVEATYLLFSLMNETEMIHHLHAPDLLLGIEGLVLTILAIGLVLTAPAVTEAQ